MRAKSRLKSGANIQIHFLKCNTYYCHKQIQLHDKEIHANWEGWGLLSKSPEIIDGMFRTKILCTTWASMLTFPPSWGWRISVRYPNVSFVPLLLSLFFSFLTSSGLIQYFFSIPFYLYPLFSHLLVVSGGFRAMLSNRLVSSYVSIWNGAKTNRLCWWFKYTLIFKELV